MQLENTVQTKERSRFMAASGWQLFAAFILGSVIVYGAGFINTAAVHNAAHDARHSQGFPCH